MLYIVLGLRYEYLLIVGRHLDFITSACIAQYGEIATLQFIDLQNMGVAVRIVLLCFIRRLRYKYLLFPVSELPSWISARPLAQYNTQVIFIRITRSTKHGYSSRNYAAFLHAIRVI